MSPLCTGAILPKSILDGAYAFFKTTLPYSPGFDGVGVVGKVGEASPGDRFL